MSNLCSRSKVISKTSRDSKSSGRADPSTSACGRPSASWRPRFPRRRSRYRSSVSALWELVRVGWPGPFQKLNSFLEMRNLGEERTQAADEAKLLECAFTRHRRAPQHDRIRRNVARHRGPRPNDDVRAYAHIVCDADPASQHDTIANCHASRIPTMPQIRQFSPTTTLWPICTRLSILVFLPMCVAASVARSLPNWHQLRHHLPAPLCRLN